MPLRHLQRPRRQGCLRHLNAQLPLIQELVLFRRPPFQLRDWSASFARTQHAINVRLVLVTSAVNTISVTHLEFALCVVENLKGVKVSLTRTLVMFLLTVLWLRMAL